MNVLLTLLRSHFVSCIFTVRAMNKIRIAKDAYFNGIVGFPALALGM